MSLIIDRGRGKAKQLRLTPPGESKKVKVSIPAGQGAARFQVRVDELIRCANEGDPVPTELLPWAATLPPATADRLTELGLLPRQTRERAKDIASHIAAYVSDVQSRRGNTEQYAEIVRLRMNKLADWLGWRTYSDIEANAIKRKLRDEGLSAQTQYHYLRYVEDFCRWMKDTHRATRQLVEKVEKPRAVPSWDRRPFEVDEMRQLLEFLDGFTWYKHQLSSTGFDARTRRLIYWLAVKTGMRRNEIRTLQRSRVHLDDRPAWIDLPAIATKNRTRASIPLPSDLAAELRAYMATRDRGDTVFPYVAERTLAEFLRRDLKAAGLGHLLEIEGMRVDFHCLRATAVTWWLNVDRLDQLTVKEMARFKTLEMVQRYSRGFRVSNGAWVDEGVSVLRSSSAGPDRVRQAS